MDTCHTCGNLDPVDHEPYRTCQAASCYGCKMLDGINDRISKAKAQLASLLNARHQLKPRLNQIHKSIIDRLPVEVVSSQCVGSEVGEGFMSPLFLGAVCRSWRRIAWSTPSLWKSLKFNIEYHTTEDESGLAIQWLKRSGQLPLFISLESAYMNQSTTAHPCCNTSPSDLPLSEGHLNITQAAPIHVDVGHILYDQLRFNWDNLLYISAMSFIIDEVIEVMRNAPQLLSGDFTIKNKESSHTIPTQVSAQVACKELVYLNVTSRTTQSFHSFLDNVVCPTLTDCTLICRGLLEVSVRSLLSFFGRSGHLLHKLTISRIPLAGQDITDILRLTPWLTDLSLTLHTHNRNGATPDAFCEALSAHLFGFMDPVTGDCGEPADPLVPHLENFALIGDFGAFPSQLIEGLFTPFVLPTTTRLRPLKVIKICFLSARHGDSIPYINEESLDKIVELQEQGVEFNICGIFDHGCADLIDMSLAKLKRM
ncbi:hypothetical protein CPB84DRAFT_1783140 [Gymnopilus junonius]|uniref:F-box domain-containing protein n=1 Tax=Gymnopilus junonius TaxID=109634 RepID=A0A9P5NKP6_GYMJU|nr:hypothetical protein CPB84DRAFT_1783140 [Gymnopilus junonius]